MIRHYKFSKNLGAASNPRHLKGYTKQVTFLGINIRHYCKMFSLYSDLNFCTPDVKNYSLNLVEKAIGYVCKLAFPLTTKEKENHFLHIFLKRPILLQKLVKVGSHFILLDHPNNIWHGEQIINFLITWFSSLKVRHSP